MHNQINWFYKFLWPAKYIDKTKIVIMMNGATYAIIQIQKHFMDMQVDDILM